MSVWLDGYILAQHQSHALCAVLDLQQRGAFMMWFPTKRQHELSLSTHHCDHVVGPVLLSPLSRWFFVQHPVSRYLS